MGIRVKVGGANTTNIAGYFDATGAITNYAIQTLGHIVPVANFTYDLGTTGLQWRALYTTELRASAGPLQLYVDAGFDFTVNVDGAGSNMIVFGNTAFQLLNLAGRFATFDNTLLTLNRTFTLPDVTGTLITTGNLSSITATGTIASGVWNGTTIGAIYGGTGQTTYLTGDTLYASAANTLSKLPIGTVGQVLTVAGGIPTWATPASGSFGQNYGSALASARTTTTSSTFQTKVTLATGALTGTYRIGWSCIADNGNLGEFRLRNQTAAVTLGATQIFKATDAGEREDINSFVEIVLAGVSQTIAIEWRDQAGGNTQGIQDAKLEIWRVS
jgi:hypothetical protein